MSIYRQGDILFVQVMGNEPIEGKRIKRKGGRIVVAEGESTGHTHAIATPGVKFFEVVRQFHEHYLVSDRPFEITHEEHDTVKLPAGVFKVIRQREYSPTEIRRVQD